ncbi:MAG: metallophosphoesterase, partial [Bacteriovoracaceae bacterium]
MSISCISDIHVRRPDDEAYQLLLQFLGHPKVKESDSVAFLGDVFDHLTGEHEGYLEKFKQFFQKVEELLVAGKRVYFIEGNHDFHFKKTFHKRLARTLNRSELDSFSYARGSLTIELGAKRHLLFHGDLLDSENKAYMRWKKIYSSKPFGFFISHILPFSIVEKIGDKASENSRERSKDSFNYHKEKEKYRQAVQVFGADLNVDRIIGGHTHIQDEFFWKDKAYYNIGYPLKD